MVHAASYNSYNHQFPYTDELLYVAHVVGFSKIGIITQRQKAYKHNGYLALFWLGV